MQMIVETILGEDKNLMFAITIFEFDFSLLVTERVVTRHRIIKSAPRKVKISFRT